MDGKIISEVSAAAEAFSKRKKKSKTSLELLSTERTDCLFRELSWPRRGGVSVLNHRPFQGAPSAGPGGRGKRGGLAGLWGPWMWGPRSSKHQPLMGSHPLPDTGRCWVDVLFLVLRTHVDRLLQGALRSCQGEGCSPRNSGKAAWPLEGSSRRGPPPSAIPVLGSAEWGNWGTGVGWGSGVWVCRKGLEKSGSLCV